MEFTRGGGRDKNNTWYLWLCYGAVRGPYTPAGRHKGELNGIDFETPKDIFPPRPGKPDWAQRAAHWEKGPDGVPMAGGRTGPVPTFSLKARVCFTGMCLGA